MAREPADGPPDGDGEDSRVSLKLDEPRRRRGCRHRESRSYPAMRQSFSQRVANPGSITTESTKFRVRMAVVCAVGLLIIQLSGALAMSSKGGDIKVEVEVPREAEMGASVDLKCNWRLLGGNSLYSVKWYKDDHEFFRYVPDNSPKILTFPQNGVSLDKQGNSEKSIRLKNLVLASTGQYRCEVSTEAPFFATSYQTSNLTVIALPDRGPEITGLSSHYAVGENVTANCTAWPSVPKANLRWTINGEPVPMENTVQHPPLAPVSSIGIPNSLGLRLEAEPRHFEGGGGLVKIKCIAEVGSRLFDAEKRVLMAYVNNQRLSAGDLLRGQANRQQFSPLQQPIIIVVSTLLAILLST